MRLALALCFLAGCAPHATKSEAPRADLAARREATHRTLLAANAFLATLDDAARARAALPDDEEHRTRWSNFPVGMIPRNGVRWGDLSTKQREAAHVLLSNALSPEGLRLFEEVRAGDEYLKAHDGDPRLGPGKNGPRRGPPPGDHPGGDHADDHGPPPGMNAHFDGPHFGQDEYYLAILGTPSETTPWMVQLGGHHLALNVTIVGAEATLAPSLPAAQPATYAVSGETIRPLAHELDAGLALVQSLTPAQRDKAILKYEVSDLVLGPGRDGKMIAPEGLRGNELDPAQRRRLLDVTHAWVGLLSDAAARAKEAEITAHLDDTYFAWSGPTTAGSPAYFRVQGPTVFIEYSPQRRFDADGLDPEHVHTIYREPANDYGKAWR